MRKGVICNFNTSLVRVLSYYYAWNTIQMKEI